MARDIMQMAHHEFQQSNRRSRYTNSCLELRTDEPRSDIRYLTRIIRAVMHASPKIRKQIVGKISPRMANVTVAMPIVVDNKSHNSGRGPKIRKIRRT